MAARALVVATLAGSLLVARDADACSGLPPNPYFAPATAEAIPANAPALVWSGDDLATVALPGMDLSGERVDNVWILRPAREFMAGATYTVTFSDGSPNLTFNAAPNASLPTNT